MTQKKTLKLKKTPADEEGAVPQEDVIVASVNSGTGKKDGSSYLTAGILALVSLGLFGALMVIQWLEWSFYHRPPTAFPL